MTITVQECLQRGFQALLNGDLEQRDKMCKLAEQAFIGSDGIAANDKQSVPCNTPIRTMKIVEELNKK